MPLSLDHLFILTEANAPMADELVAAGFVEGPSNTHPGQGTANRRFFFENFTLEFLFIVNEGEAKHGAGKNLNFPDRLSSHSASPFGLVVRTDSEVEFAHWLYWPDYFHGKMSFSVGDNSKNLAEPLCICMPKELPKKSPDPEYTNVNKTFTHLSIQVPLSALSDELQCFNVIEGVSIQAGEQHELELNFNHAQGGQVLNIETPAAIRLNW